MDALEKLATVDPVSRTALRAPKAVKDLPPVGIITAGTGDIPVASEARATLEAMGYPALYYENTEGGHSNDSDPILNSKRWARHYVYLARQLGLGGAQPQ